MFRSSLAQVILTLSYTCRKFGTTKFGKVSRAKFHPNFINFRRELYYILIKVPFFCLFECIFKVGVGSKFSYTLKSAALACLRPRRRQCCLSIIYLFFSVYIGRLEKFHKFEKYLRQMYSDSGNRFIRKFNLDLMSLIFFLNFYYVLIQY